MKSILTLALAILMSVGLSAQNIIDKHFEQYKSQDNFTTVHVSSKMFELAGYIDFETDDSDIQEIRDFITTITSFDMIAGREVENARSSYRSAIKKVENSHEELMRVDDKEGSFTFFIDEKRGVVREVVMVGTTDQELIIFSLTGKMDLRELSKMANKMQKVGFSKLDMIEEHGAAHMRVYPNPAHAGHELTVEIPSNMAGGEARVFDMNGRIIKSYDVESGKQAMPTSGLSDGNYVLEVIKDGVTLKKRFVIQSKS